MMNLKNVFLLILSIQLISCKNKKRTSNLHDRIFFKEFVSGENHFQYFFYSTISNISPFYLTKSYDGQSIDTICVSTNLTDFSVVEDTIFLSFDGEPMLYENPVLIPNKSGHFYIIYNSKTKMDNKVWEEIYKYSKKGQKIKIVE